MRCHGPWGGKFGHSTFPFPSLQLLPSASKTSWPSSRFWKGKSWSLAVDPLNTWAGARGHALLLFLFTSLCLSLRTRRHKDARPSPRKLVHPHFLPSLHSAANFPSLKLSLISLSSFPVFLSRTECNPEPVFLTALVSCHFTTKFSFPQKKQKQKLRLFISPILPLLSGGNRREDGVCVCVCVCLCVCVCVCVCTHCQHGGWHTLSYFTKSQSVLEGPFGAVGMRILPRHSDLCLCSNSCQLQG